MSGYQYNPQAGYVGWSLPQQALPPTSTVTVSGRAPVTSATPVWQALGNNQVANTQWGTYQYNPNQLLGTVGNNMQGIPATAGQTAQNTLQSTMTQANQAAVAANARPDAWSLEGAFGSANGNYSGWANSAISGVTALGNLYMGYQGLKLAKKELAERTALQRANFKNQSRTMNAQYRDQASGRGYNGMNQEAKTALGQQYANRKVSETY